MNLINTDYLGPNELQKFRVKNKELELLHKERKKFQNTYISNEIKLS